MQVPGIEPGLPRSCQRPSSGTTTRCTSHYTIPAESWHFLSYYEGKIFSLAPVCVDFFLYTFMLQALILRPVPDIYSIGKSEPTEECVTQLSQWTPFIKTKTPYVICKD